MKTAVSELVYERVVQPFSERKYGVVAAELEYLIIPNEESVSLADMGSEFLQYLITEHGFEQKCIGSDGRYMRVSREGDDVSFDYSYILLEFSMEKQKSFIDLYEHFIPLFRIAKEYYAKRGCQIGCFGRNPFHNHRGEYTQDPFYTMIREYQTQVMGLQDLNQHFTNMASVQTHIDVPLEHLLDTYNLFNELDFVGALLFSNSGMLEEESSTVCCVRDANWETSGIPNIGVYEKDFASLREVAEAISKEEIFIEATKEGLQGMQPVSLETYFGEQGQEPERFSLFRSFKHVVLNSYHVLEVRSDCTQPLADCFLPGVFHLGIAMNYKKAKQAVKQFKTEHDITWDNAMLRKMAAEGQPIAEQESLYVFLWKLYDIAKEGLLTRGYGEEKLMIGLEERLEKRENPAMKAKRLLRETGDFGKVVSLYSQERTLL